MYGPPLCRKRKVRIACKVRAYVYGLVERVTTLVLRQQTWQEHKTP